MKQARQFSINILLILFIVLIQSGCSTISRWYDNFVSYFNVYYNASRLFDEAEDEIHLANLSNRTKDVTAQVTNTQQSQIPGGAKQKLGQVIDKCSYILAFYPLSNLVDDALMLVGKSFFYQEEYLKAERKFEELIVQYPNSSLLLEAQLWLAYTEEKLNKYEEGIKIGNIVATSASQNGDKQIESQARFFLGNVYYTTNQFEKAINEYEKCIELTDDDEMKSEAQISIGKIYFSIKKYDKGIEAFLKVKKFSDDIYLNYYSGLQAAIGYRELGEYEKGITLLDQMIEDFRNRDYLSSLLYERANDYYNLKMIDSAIAEYTYIDTTYKNSEYSIRSAYKLGAIYENEKRDYENALKYYEKVNLSKTSIVDIGSTAKQKYTAFTRYFDAWKRLSKVDSLMSLLRDTLSLIQADTSGKSMDSTQLSAIVNSDSTQLATQLGSDSTKVVISQKVKPPAGINADSINIIKAKIAQELGDIFYSEVIVPDSAFYWYNQSLSLNYKSANSPRILYILAELSRTNPENNYPKTTEYYMQLIRDFPESIYANEARRFIGQEVTRVELDSAKILFTEAEKKIDQSQYNLAIDLLKQIINLYPQSAYAAKSEYAIGWIYEHNLLLPDSAIMQYKKVAKNYSGTMYAESAKKRIVEETLIDTTKSIKSTPNPNFEVSPPTRKDEVDEEEIIKRKKFDPLRKDDKSKLPKEDLDD